MLDKDDLKEIQEISQILLNQNLNNQEITKAPDIHVYDQSINAKEELPGFNNNPERSLGSFSFRNEITKKEVEKIGTNEVKKDQMIIENSDFSNENAAKKMELIVKKSTRTKGSKENVILFENKVNENCSNNLMKKEKKIPILSLTIIEGKPEILNKIIEISDQGLKGSIRKPIDGYSYFGVNDIKNNEEEEIDFNLLTNDGIAHKHFYIRFDICNII